MRWKNLQIVVAIAALALGPGVHARDTTQDAVAMDQVVRELVDTKQFMGSVLVARGDRILFNRAYGSANLEWGIANTTATKFRLGSLTKQFTGASLLLLEERGKLRLDDPVKKYFADAPAAWNAITLHHLLTHTSGIPNFTSFPEYEQRKSSASSAADIVGWFKDKPLEFTPGEKMVYSNSGYLLLGYVIEHVAGVPYAEFVQNNIFEPLGMKDSGYDSHSAVIERRAAGYTQAADTLVNADFIHMSVPHAAGALYSTTEDLLRWQRGLYGGKLLSARSLTKMTTAFKNNYALGVGVTSDPRLHYSHGGGIDGFNTYLIYYPKTEITVVALANLNGRAPRVIAQKLGALAHGDSIESAAGSGESPR